MGGKESMVEKSFIELMNLIDPRDASMGRVR